MWSFMRKRNLWSVLVLCSFYFFFFSVPFDWQETSTHFNYIWPFYNMTKLSNRCLLWVWAAWTYDREANNLGGGLIPLVFSHRLGHTISNACASSVFFWKVTHPTSSFWIWSPLNDFQRIKPSLERYPQLASNCHSLPGDAHRDWSFIGHGPAEILKEDEEMDSIRTELEDWK